MEKQKIPHIKEFGFASEWLTNTSAAIQHKIIMQSLDFKNHNHNTIQYVQQNSN